MAEVYRKFGRRVRYESGVFVRVDEAGEAIEDDRSFVCRPVAHSVALPPIDETDLQRVVREVESIVAPPLRIERLVVSEGVAVHEFGDHRWRETTRRIHLSMTFRSNRAIVDLGDFGVDDVRAIAAALPRSGESRDAPSRVILAPNVTAALMPSLIDIAPPNVRLVQVAGGLDGKGQPVEDYPLSQPPWPNWYRPSYRTRPVRAPFHVRAECDVTVLEDGLPRAIALLAPPAGLLLSVLCVDGASVFPASLRVLRIDAIGTGTKWYPYGAGSFGAEMML
ncbi:MAG: hypothetical protein ACXW3E_03935 [Thermoanaerobaculia bacterium]